MLRNKNNVNTSGYSIRQQPYFKRSPFALQKGSFLLVKGLVLECKRGRFGRQKDSFWRMLSVECCQQPLHLIIYISNKSNQHHHTISTPQHLNWGFAPPRAPTQQIYYNFFSKNFVVKKQIAKFANVKMQEQHNTLHSDTEDLTKQNNRRTF